ncbi:serine protease grass-like [Chironomus tepperi]|uniref:serine protease grass-like n=1 Tax=Chironomus tepperi TaxID=113505 RepID=UPI00391F8E4F
MVPIPRVPTDFPPPPAEIQLSLDEVRKHPNYRLINANSCGLQTSSRIAKGIKAALNEFPWAVLLGYNDGLDEILWDCGGNLISEQYVLTAAHCIKRDLEVARLGEHTISTEKDCDNFGSCTDPVQEIKIEKSIKHPEYGKPETRHDIGIAKLAVPADTTKINVRTICLPTIEAIEITKIKSRNFTMTGDVKLLLWKYEVTNMLLPYRMG